jgi:AcrR family transcriptional regulator
MTSSKPKLDKHTLSASLSANPGKGRMKSEEKRQQITDAATALFIENGFDGISMDRIAKIAGVSKQTVYSHFGNKEDLFKRCIEGKCIAGAMTPELFNEDLPIGDVMMDLATHFSALLMSEDVNGVMRVCIAGAEKHPEVSQLFFEAGPENLSNMLAQHLQIRADRHELKIDNCVHAAWQFLFMVKSEHAFRSVLGLEQVQSEEEIEAYLKSCVSVFLRAHAP